MTSAKPVAAAARLRWGAQQPCNAEGPAALIAACGSGYRIIAALGLCLFVLLSGCTSLPLPKHTPTLALPMQLHVQREQADQRQDWLLVIQQEDAGLRWSLMDPLGIPLARQLLQNSHWKADGLLPPNPEARELFAALLFALTPNDQLADNYPQAKSSTDQRAIDQRWHVHYRQPQVFSIDLANGVHYTISPLDTSSNTETAP